MTFDFPGLDGGGVGGEGPCDTEEEDGESEPGEEVGDDEDEEVRELEDRRAEVLNLLERALNEILGDSWDQRLNVRLGGCDC